MKNLTLFIVLVCILSNVFLVNANDVQTNYTGEELVCPTLYMVDKDSDMVYYSKNARTRVSVASLTKIMTYIVAVENIPNYETAKIRFSEDVNKILKNSNAWTAQIQVGEELTVLDYLKMMMVYSAGDAAIQIALYYDELQGFQNEITTNLANKMENSPFIKLMNDKAKELGCNDTNFTNPSGLYHQNSYSTAEDVAKFIKYAMSLPYFNEIVALDEFVIPKTNLQNERVINNTNALISNKVYGGQYVYEYADGIKTGRLKEAGNCLASSATKDGETYIIVALGAEISYLHNNAAKDSISLYEWAFNNFIETEVVKADDVVSKAEFFNTYFIDYVSVSSEENVSLNLPSDFDLANFEVELVEKQDLVAPIKKGDIVGTINLKFDGKILETMNAIANANVEKFKEFKLVNIPSISSNFNVFNYVIFGIVLIIFVLLCIVLFHRNSIRKIMRNRIFKK